MSDRADLPSEADALLRRARAGDADAFWVLAERARAYLKEVAARILHDRLPSDGSDVVSKGLLQALEKLPQFAGDRHAVFLGWLRTIVYNEALQTLRQAGRLRPLPENDSGGEVLDGSSSGPEKKAIDRERAVRVHAILERLPEEDRTVIRLRFLKGLDHREIAQRLGRNYDAVRQSCSRAMKRFAKAWGDEA
jgi:RNA polymerase sigma-70 factor (ECF subfamily)